MRMKILTKTNLVLSTCLNNLFLVGIFYVKDNDSKLNFNQY